MPTRLLLDGPDIETLLARVQEEHGEAARIVHAEKVRSGGLGGFFSKERYEVSVELPDGAAPAGPSGPSVTDVAMPALTFTDVAVSDDDLPPAALLLADAVDDDAPSTMSTERSAFADVLGSIRAGLGDRPAELAPAATSFVPAVPAPLTTPARVVTPPAPLPTPAAAVVPAPRRTPTQQVPRPPRTAGAVLVLVGEARVAYDVATELAATMRIDPAQVLVASPAPVVKLPASRRIADPVAARVRAGKLLTAGSASIVVVDLPIGADPEWSRQVVDALGATAVWAMVDATRKIADLNRWSKGLSRIDALVVHNAAASEDAGSVRALGLPVALLDGRTATDAAWRAVGSEPPLSGGWS